MFIKRKKISFSIVYARIMGNVLPTLFAVSLHNKNY